MLLILVSCLGFDFDPSGGEMRRASSHCIMQPTMMQVQWSTCCHEVATCRFCSSMKLTTPICASFPAASCSAPVPLRKTPTSQDPEACVLKDARRAAWKALESSTRMDYELSLCSVREIWVILGPRRLKAEGNTVVTLSAFRGVYAE